MSDSTKIIFLKRDDKATFESFNKGEFIDYSLSHTTVLDDILKFSINKNLVQKLADSFPDPRRMIEVPFNVVLLTQIAQKLQKKEGMVHAPQLINDAEIFSMLGFAPFHLKHGFNSRNKNERTAPFHGEVLKHILNSIKSENLISWYNNDVVNIFTTLANKKNHKLKVCDGMEIEIDKKDYAKFPGAGVKKKENGEYVFGYKVVWLMDLLGNKGIITHLKIAPINENDNAVVKKLFKEIKLSKNCKIIFDRGFLDFDLINDLKSNFKIDVFIPLKQNLNITKKIIVNKMNEEKWYKNPLYEDQTYCELNSNDLSYEDLESEFNGLFKKGALVRITKKNGEIEYIPFVTTDGRQTAQSVIRTYFQRSELEEVHRQLKVNFSLESQPSRKYTHIIFRIILLIIAFNTFSLFKIDDVVGDKSESIKTARQKRKLEMNPNVVIFCQNTFGLIKFSEIMKMALYLKKENQVKIINALNAIDPPI